MNREQRKKLLFVVIVLILVALVLYSGLRILESAIFSNGLNQMQTTSRVLIRNGVRYYPRKDITVILVIGINQSGKVEETESNHGGAADMLMLLVFDEKTETCNIIQLNRDMMVTMPVLSENGKEINVFYGQLAFSHAYGDGMKISCRNVRKTVSNLFYGLQIDYYVSMNMDTIPIVNDAVGGVKVNVVDDFSAVDPDLPMGEVVLYGQQAVTFVQTRWYVGDEQNISRMERQREYLNGFMSALRTKLAQDATFAVKTYSEITDYIVTDCSVEVLSRLYTDYGDYDLGEILSLEGENILGDGLYEFYVDEEALDALIIRMFYSPK